MAEYIEIKGIQIESLASDPPAPQAGQLWYNTTSTTIKGYGAQGTGAWASAGALNQAHQSNAFSIGIQTAGLCAGGQDTPSPSPAACETYDGTSWTEGNNINTARTAGVAAGTISAGVIAGGYVAESSWTTGYVNCEEYNGTSWSNVNNLTTAMATTSYGTVGTQTSAMQAGRKAPPSAPQGTCSTYDGTSWTAINEFNTAGGNNGGAGTATAAIAMGRDYSPGPKGIVELYDGTCWTEVANLNTAREGNSGAGTSSLCMLICGNGGTQAVEHWNGTSFATIASTANQYDYNGALGGTISAAVMGGNYPPTTPSPTACEEWTVPDATKTFTAT